MKLGVRFVFAVFNWQCRHRRFCMRQSFQQFVQRLVNIFDLLIILRQTNQLENVMTRIDNVNHMPESISKHWNCSNWAVDKIQMKSFGKQDITIINIFNLKSQTRDRKNWQRTKNQNTKRFSRLFVRKIVYRLYRALSLLTN